MRPILLGFALACVALLGAACTGEPGEPTPSPTVAPTAVVQKQLTVQATPAPTTTSTSAPTPAVLPHLITLEALNVRSGPGIEYPIVGALAEGGAVRVQGRAAETSWYRIECPDDQTGTECWVIGDERFVQVKSDQGDVAAVAVVPTPLAPAAEQCNAAKPSGWVHYTVKEGDSVWSIAVRHGITLMQLRAVNCLDEVVDEGATVYVRPRSTPRPTVAPVVRSSGATGGGNGGNVSRSGGGGGSSGGASGGSDGGSVNPVVVATSAVAAAPAGGDSVASAEDSTSSSTADGDSGSTLPDVAADDVIAKPQ